MEQHVTTECCTCGILIAVSAEYLSNLKKYKHLFYCPNGHGQSFTKSTEETLKKDLNRKRERIIELEQENEKLKNKRCGRPRKMK